MDCLKSMKVGRKPGGKMPRSCATCNKAQEKIFDYYVMEERYGYVRFFCSPKCFRKRKPFLDQITEEYKSICSGKK